MTSPTTTASAVPAVSAVSVQADGAALGGRLAEPTGPSRALIVAIHGGTYDSEYYAAGPDSLLALGPAVGYTVVALDRPGYGASATVTGLGFAGQTTALAAGVDGLRRHYGLPCVLVGHSIGGMLALQVAAALEVPPSGVEVSGLGDLWQPGIREMWSGLIGDAAAVELPPEAHASVMFGPDATRTAEAIARNAELLRAMPMPELVDVVRWSEQLPEVAGTVTAPVRLTLAEYDNIWQSDDAAREAVRRHFAGPVEVTLFRGAGHSIELHRRARAYALGQLAFVESCRDLD